MVKKELARPRPGWEVLLDPLTGDLNQYLHFYLFVRNCSWLLIHVEAAADFLGSLGRTFSGEP